jgi:NADPH:quinone reductase
MPRRSSVSICSSRFRAETGVRVGGQQSNSVNQRSTSSSVSSCCGERRMRAWVVESLTAAGRMMFRDISVPEPTHDACLVRVEAAGVNFLDTLMIRGQYQIRPLMPFTPGIEVVGTVVGSGPDSPYAKGERICAMLDFGGYAEYAVPRVASERVPEGMTIREAAGLPIIYPTAFLALRHRAELRSGETVLVHAGAGGVGSASIQLAKHWGARVIATAGGATKRALCRQLGADAAIDYQAEPLAEAIRRETSGRGVDVVIDPVGGEVTRESLRCLAWGGRLVIVGFAGGVIPELAANRLLLKNAAALGVYWGAYRDHHPDIVTQVFRDIVDLHRAGVIRPLVRDVFPLDQAEHALEAIASRRTVGKVALLPFGEAGQ